MGRISGRYCYRSWNTEPGNPGTSWVYGGRKHAGLGEDACNRHGREAYEILTSSGGLFARGLLNNHR